MRYQIRHTTTYEYAEAVTLAHHILRLKPRDDVRQRCLKHGVHVDPQPSVLQSRYDCYGNLFSFISVSGDHTRFTVESTADVVTTPSVLPAAEDTPAWEQVRDQFMGDSQPENTAAWEFVFPSPSVGRHPELHAFAAPSFTRDLPLFEAVRDLTERIFKEFTFDDTATTVATPLNDVLKLRRGVCQDFAHLEIGCLRAMGLPARYVSGYLETVPPPGKERLVGADASHAWVSFYCPGSGWIDVDPTNNLFPSGRHVTVAWGRDYHDVSPIRGVLLGGGAHDVKVAVDVVPQPESAAPRP